VATGKRRKALGASRAGTASVQSLGRRSELDENRTCRDSQLSVSKRKAAEISSSGCPSEPASRRHAPSHMFGDGPRAQDNTDEGAAQGSRQPDPTGGGLSYSSVVAGTTGLQQTSGPHKSKAKGSNPTEPAASSEAATRRMSLVDMSGPLCGMTDGTTSSTQQCRPSGKTAEQLLCTSQVLQTPAAFSPGCGVPASVGCQPNSKGTKL
jgi:hypothetical protein